MAQTAIEASREWRLNRIAGTEHTPIIPLLTASTFAEATPTQTSGRRRVVSTAAWQRDYHVSVRAVDLIPPLIEMPRGVRMPRSKTGLIRFATMRLGREVGQRIATLAAARPAYGGHRLRTASLRFAVGFLVAHQNTWRLPDGVFLPPSGNVQVSWQVRRARVVAQFEPNEVVWFSVLEDGQLQLTGRVSAQEFAAQQRIHEAVRP